MIIAAVDTVMRVRSIEDFSSSVNIIVIKSQGAVHANVCRKRLEFVLEKSKTIANVIATTLLSVSNYALYV